MKKLYLIVLLVLAPPESGKVRWNTCPTTASVRRPGRDTHRNTANSWADHSKANSVPAGLNNAVKSQLGLKNNPQAFGRKVTELFMSLSATNPATYPSTQTSATVEVAARTAPMLYGLASVPSPFGAGTSPGAFRKLNSSTDTSMPGTGFPGFRALFLTCGI